MLSLPPELESAIATALRALPSAQWQHAARTLSQRYRDRDNAARPTQTHHNPEQPALSTQHSALSTQQALGYAALVLPAAYAQLAGAISATLARTPPTFQPTTLLDIGSGPGTALWAATQAWPTLHTLHAYEREPAFIALGQQLASASTNPALKQTQWRQITLTGPLPASTPLYDLIIIGHVLNELDEPTRHQLVAAAWQHCSGLLLIVEPGTSAAFPIVRAARDQLLPLDAHTIAPCAHDLPCPLANDWCHFPQRLNRPPFQRRAKQATAGWEEAKFSYAAMARFPPQTPIFARLIHQPHLTKAGAQLTLSTHSATIERPQIPKRNRPLYRQAADLHWGDALASPLEEREM